jgi:hypothetical protein
MAEPDDTTPLNALTRGRPGRRFRVGAWPLALILVWAALAVLDLVVIAPFSAASQHGAAKSAGQSSRVHRQAGPGSKHGHGARARHRRHARHSVPSPSPSPTPRVLDPVSASAFGPAGISSGDNPSSAPDAIDASTTTAWQTQWYATAAFGSLKTGTGLLVDMGKPVRITSVRILMASATGANLKLYTGAEPVLADDAVQASVSDVGGAVNLALAKPERARYLVIWFTLLPPDSDGTYRAIVYNVKVTGTAGPHAPA